MKVYIELLFLDNLIMNFIILYFSGRFARLKTNYPRILAGAAAGGIYACCMFAMQGVLSFVLIRILVSLSMCFIAFYKKKQLKTYFKSVLYLYIITFVMGGAAFAFLNMTSSDYLIKGGIIIGSAVVRYALCGIFLGIICLALFKRLYSLHANKQLMYDIRVEFLGKKMNCSAYLDTGNVLKEPLSGLPVIIVEKEIIRDIIPDGMIKVLDGANLADVSKEDWFTRVRVLPCKGIFQKQEALFGFKPDTIRLIQNDKEKELTAVIAVTNDVLNKTGDYHALLGPECLA